MKTFGVAQILMMGWLGTRGGAQPDTPDPLHAPGNFPAQPSAKNLEGATPIDVAGKFGWPES